MLPAISAKDAAATSSQEGTQDEDEQAAHWPALSHGRGDSGWGSTWYWPWVVKVHKSRNDFSEPTLASSHTQKTLNSLTWDTWFSLVNSALLMFRLYGLSCKTPIYPSSSLTFSEQSLRATLKDCPLGLKFSESPPNKTKFSTFRLCIFFSF